MKTSIQPDTKPDLPFDFHVHDALRVEYRVAASAPLAPGCARIEREVRSAGGNGVIAARALASWGARVLLTGNPIGDDSHGKFLVRELSGAANLEFQPQIEADCPTPYAILLQAESKIQTLLNPSAASLHLPPRPGSLRATHFLCASSSSLTETENLELPAATQTFAALSQSLHDAAWAYFRWKGVIDEDATRWAREIAHRYKEAFGDFDVIIGAEEMAALTRLKRPN